MLHPIDVIPLLELKDFGITSSQLCFDMVTMESDRFIACRDKAVHATSITVIDLRNPAEPITLPLPSDSAIMHPVQKIIAVRYGKMLQIIDIEEDKVMKVHNHHEVVIFWRWIDERTIGFVSHDTSVFHWALDGNSDPVMMFSIDHKMRERCIIVDYRADKEHKFLALTGIAKNSRGGEGGSIQLYNTQSGQSRHFDGCAASFVNLHLEGNSHPSNFLVYSSNKGETMLKIHMLFSHDSDMMHRKPPSNVHYSNVNESDYPISIHASSKQGVVYLLTKRGFVHVFNIDPTTLIYSGQISEESISIAAHNCHDGIVGVRMKGHVLSLAMNERKMIKYISESNRELARKINDRWMWPVVPSAPFLQLPGQEAVHKEHHRKVKLRDNVDVDPYLTDSIKHVLVAAGQDPMKIRKKDIKFVYDFVEQYKQDHLSELKAEKEHSISNSDSSSLRSLTPTHESANPSSSNNPFLQDISTPFTEPVEPPPLPSQPPPVLISTTAPKFPPVPAPRPSLAKSDNKTHAELLARAEKAERERDEWKARSEEIERRYRQALEMLGKAKFDEGSNEKTSIQNFAHNSCKIGIQGLLEEFKELRLLTHPIGDIPKFAFDTNPDKNRYQDVYCVDESRVILSGESSDYINANWVEVKEGQRQYICTQAPMVNTIEDFWRMVWQEKCRSIVMLCNIMEYGKKKCEQYWPETVGEEVSFGPYRVRTVAKETCDKILTITTLSISDGSETVELEHILWNDWPDRGVPSETLVCFKLLDRIKYQSPTVIHCSAGIGRTGTIVALDLLTSSLQAGEEKTAKEIVTDLRSKRHGSVQTDIQYLFIHRALIELGLSKQMIDESEVSGFIEEYDALCEQRGFF